ncbi:DUF3592 domain-containing protein [Bremerella sp. JC817]|uniref:DUF3592 domain-containing protein n=1 Tax=Bremerella sp. JC817 TaxID=3231756 RepID=UPI0034591CB9
MFDFWLPAAMLAFFNLIGILLLVAGIRELHLAWRSRRWEETVATIEESSLDPCKRKTKHGEEVIYLVKLQYHYQDRAGDQHTGNRISFSYHPTKQIEDHQELCDILQPGRKVQVYYNPSRPDQCTLVGGVEHGSFSSIIIALMWLSMSISIPLMTYWPDFSDQLLVRSMKVMP